MVKRGKMQRVVMSILATMFVASLALAVVSLVWPAPVSAEYYKVCYDGHCYRQYCDGCFWCHEYKWAIYQGYPNPHCADRCYIECFSWPEYCCP